MRSSSLRKAARSLSDPSLDKMKCASPCPTRDQGLLNRIVIGFFSPIGRRPQQLILARGLGYPSRNKSSSSTVEESGWKAPKDTAAHLSLRYRPAKVARSIVADRHGKAVVPAIIR